ncbi:MAG: regulatory protein RecX [Candidatus Rokubacteria bacterium]|nr:regulatory protein RecX [Candidatus Rokubacteria bacterium]
MDLLSRRAWTRSELTRRLMRRGAPAEVAEVVVADMVGRGYVDDAAFARHFVETRAGRGYGAARLAADLRSRGVEAALVTAALGELDRDAQLDQARALARSRLPALRRASPQRAAGRLRDYLLRRGFQARIVMKIAREMTTLLSEGPQEDPT